MMPKTLNSRFTQNGRQTHNNRDDAIKKNSKQIKQRQGIKEM